MDDQSRVELEPEEILGIDNIALELPIAGVGSRVLAAVIDYFVLYVLLFILFFGFLFGAAALDLTGWTMVAVSLAVYFVLNWGYFAGQEILFGGRTLGKKAVGVRVVGRAGGKPGAGSLLVRNLLREIDIFVGIPMIALDSLARRLGDRAGGTLVVHDRTNEQDLMLRRIPPGWDLRRIGLVESFLRRESEMTAENRARLAERIFALVDREAPTFLDEVRADSDRVFALRRAFEAKERI